MTTLIALHEQLYLNVQYLKTAHCYATMEEGPGVEQIIETHLQSVDLVGLGGACDIIDCLTEKQKITIVKKLGGEL